MIEERNEGNAATILIAHKAQYQSLDSVVARRVRNKIESIAAVLNSSASVGGG